MGRLVWAFVVCMQQSEVFSYQAQMVIRLFVFDEKCIALILAVCFRKQIVNI